MGMLARLRDGLVSCPLSLRGRIVGVVEVGFVIFGGNFDDDEGDCSGNVKGVAATAAAVATLTMFCDRAEGRVGDVSRDADGDLLTEVAIDVLCGPRKGCVVCFADCDRSSLVRDAAYDLWVVASRGLCAGLTSAPLAVADDLSIFDSVP